MKIGILSLPIHTNYGGVLQSYALQTILERLGHEVVVFNKNTYISINSIRMLPVYFSRFVLKKLGKYKGPIQYEKLKNEKKRIACYYTNGFVKKHLKTINFNNINELCNYDLNAIVVGSDQIWRYHYFKNIDANPQNMFLAFTENMDIKRVSYAASFGTDKWELSSHITDKCKSYVNKFDLISVREENAVQLCKKYFDVSASWVLDPTMLITRTDYEKLINKSPIDRGLVSYILDYDEQKKSIISFLSSIYGEDYSINRNVTPVMPVEFWLDGLIGARMVVTDSFHGTAFSINFNKPFVVLSNLDRGQSRLLSVLKMFCLEDRLVQTPEQALSVMKQPIDWFHVNKLLTEYRSKSINFLKNI